MIPPNLKRQPAREANLSTSDGPSAPGINTTFEAAFSRGSRQRSLNATKSHPSAKRRLDQKQRREKQNVDVH